jgi:hypothetical protein
MGTQRASNKDILDAINALTQAITATHVAPKQAPAPVVAAPAAVLPMSQERSKPAPVVVEQAQDTSVQVPESYLTLMTGKVEQACKDDGKDRIMYARHNLRGETKLAYCLAERWSTLKDKGMIGALKHISA